MALDTTDTPELLQVQGPAPTLGYLLVGAKIEPLPTGVLSPRDSTRTWLLIGSAVLVVALALVATVARRRAK